MQWNVSSILPSDYCSKATKPLSAPVILCPISSQWHKPVVFIYFALKQSKTASQMSSLPVRPFNGINSIILPLAQQISAEQRYVFNITFVFGLITGDWVRDSWICIFNFLAGDVLMVIWPILWFCLWQQREPNLRFSAQCHSCLKSECSEILMKDYLIYSPSVNGFPSLTITWATTTLAYVVEMIWAKMIFAQINLQNHFWNCFFFVPIRILFSKGCVYSGNVLPHIK